VILRRFKPITEVADLAGETLADAEVKVADELDKFPKATGARGNPGGRGAKIVRDQKGPAHAPTLAELGMAKKRVVRARKLKTLGAKKRHQLIAGLKKEGKAVNPASILTQSRKEAKAEKKHQLAAAAFNADGPFSTVVIDWPWPMQKIDRDERPNQDAFDYPVMKVEDMPDFWFKEIEFKPDGTSRIEDDCHLFMWTTHKFLPAALELVKKCGFTYVLLMTWNKPGGYQPLDLPQYNTEFIVYARRGTPLFIDTKDFFTGFEAQSREHSRKPAEFYETIARVTGNSRLDVFAREERPGFAQYSNERKFKQVEHAEAAE
jgi:N6-adenosine-specific RNA methylase IME4